MPRAFISVPTSGGRPIPTSGGRHKRCGEAGAGHDLRELTDFMVIHSLEPDRHEHRRHLIVSNFALHIAIDHVLDFLVGQHPAIAFFHNQIIHSHFGSGLPSFCVYFYLAISFRKLVPFVASFTSNISVMVAAISAKVGWVPRFTPARMPFPQTSSGVYSLV